MSKEFKKLFEEDQYHTKRWAEKYTDKEYYSINKKLRSKVDELINQGKAKDSYDYFVASLLYHHAFKINTSKKAIKYAKKSWDMGGEKDKWMIASTTDRLLQLQGKPQKYGTQYVETKSGKPKLYKTNPKTTDKERKEYGLPTLKELKERFNQ